MPPRNAYLLGEAEKQALKLPDLARYEGSKVTPLVGTAEYAAAVKAALDGVGAGGDEFVLIAGWWLGLKSRGQFPLADGVTLRSVLQEKAGAGVDVRVLGWVSGALMSSGDGIKRKAPTIEKMNAGTIESIVDLRKPRGIGQGAALNLIGHTAGAVHTKLVVIGSGAGAVGFTGGIDFVPDRWLPLWHDVAARVEGPAVQALYDWFALLWNENAGRPRQTFRLAALEVDAVLPGTPRLEARELPVARSGDHVVQSVRTVPAFNYKWWWRWARTRPPASGSSGTFEVRAAWEKAIGAATRYIYIEDQAFWSEEVLGWVNRRLKRPEDVRVILLAPGGADPNDPQLPDAEILTLSIDDGLLAGLTEAQRARVRMFRRFARLPSTPPGPSAIVSVTDPAGPLWLVELDLRPPKGQSLKADALRDGGWVLRVGGVEHTVTGNVMARAGENMRIRVEPRGDEAPPEEGAVCELVAYKGVLVHAKTTIVDDRWALIGSANCMRRSLYTDWEHAVAFVDEGDTAVKEYRKKLWASHFDGADAESFDDLDAALERWPPYDPDRVDGALPPTLVPQRLPLERRAFSVEDRRRYELFTDADARLPWAAL